MARHATLRKKKVGKSVYWFTKAGGETYFGNVQAVPYKDAKQLFLTHVQSLSDLQGARKTTKGFTAGELMDAFLDWVKKNRSFQTYTTRRIYCSRFAAFRVGNTRIADVAANRIKGADLEAFLAYLRNKLDLNPQTLLHAETSVRHCWNWATKYPSPTPYLPSAYRPFSAVERTRVPLKALTENDLITPEEVECIFSYADIDLNQFRRFGLARTIERIGSEKLKRSGSFSEMLRCYYHTGARTDELASCEVGDVLVRTRQIVLGRHKRSRTQRTPTVRHITLNDQAFEILAKQCSQKNEHDKVFLRESGGHWTVRGLAKRFERVKEISAAVKCPIREKITIYDFRHLWISEAMMAGNDVATVARMAGTSIAMIERVYGHFRNEHLQEAQRRLDEARQKRRT